MSDFKNKLSFTTIVKNEAPYIVEWLEFHKLVGVEKFYIYDNESTDNLKNILKPYIEDGIVVYHYFPGSEMQIPAYRHAIKNYKNDTKYMGFIDADEFVMPEYGRNITEIVEETLKDNPNAAGLAINWRVYGSNGFEKMPNGLVIENYLYRAKDSFVANRHIKTICDPRKVLLFPNPHCPIYQEKFYNIDENNNIVNGPFNLEGKCQKIRINHYFTKSKTEYILKALRGKADTKTKRSMKDFYEHDKNDVRDDSIMLYVNQVRENCKKIIDSLNSYPDYAKMINQKPLLFLSGQKNIEISYQLMRDRLLKLYDSLVFELQRRNRKR